MIQANGHNTKQSNNDQSSSEKVKCSYLIKYSNRNDDDQKHTAIPYFITAAKPLGSMIDEDRSYMPECSCCNIKIGLEDTRFHITHVKTSDVQKASFEKANHLIRPNSCLCVGCYQTIKKRTSTKNYTKRACIIMACEQVACHIFNSKLIDILKSTILINKIHFRVQTNDEKKLHKTSFCNAHYDQLLLITQCQLCGNRSLQKFNLHKDIVHEYQLILDEDNIPATVKFGTLICKPCHIYILLRRDKSTIIPSELQKHCDATKTRIINNNKLKMKELESIKLAKYDINMEKKKEENQLLMVTSLPKNISNAFTNYSSIPSKSVTKGTALDAITIRPPLVNSTSVAASMQSLTAVIMTTIDTALATEEAHLTTITKPISETPITAELTKATEDVKLTVATEKPTVLIFKRKRQRTFLDEHSSVPRTKKRIVNRLTVTTDCIKHTISGLKPTIPVHKPTISGIKPTTPVIQFHKPSIQVVKTTTPVDKPIIQVDESMTLVDKPTTLVDKPTIPVHKPLYNKSLIFSPVLRPIFSSKWPVPKKQLFKNLKVPVDKPTIADHKRLYKKSIVFSPVLRPYFNSKRYIPKKYKKTPESIAPIRKPTKLQQTNQSHQNTLDSQSTSPRTEFSELSHQRPGRSILSSTTSDMNQVFENIKVPIDKPVIPVEKLMIQVNQPTITNYTPMDNKSPVGPTVLSPFYSSKCTELKKNGNLLESVSPIIEPTQLKKNQLHQLTLDSLSMSLQTEFPELSLHQGETSTLSSTTSDMNQLFENLNIPVDKSSITDHKRLDNKSPISSPLLSPFSSSKCDALKKYKKTPKSVLPIKNPTQLQTNQSHQNTLDSQSTSPRTEFPELRCQRAGPTTLSSTTSDMNQVFENIKVPIDEHVIPVEKPMIPVNKPTITNYTPLVNKSPVEPPVLSPLFSSKCTELKKNRNPLESVSPIIEPTQLQDNQLHQHTLESPESVSPIIEPTQLQTNQSHQNTLDSQSTSPRTEFPELRCQRAGPTTLSSTTSEMNQIFENIKVPIDKPVIPIEKPMIPVNKPTITNYTPSVNKSPIEPPVLSPFISSKCTELKKNRNPLESVSPIIEPTQLQDNQLHQYTLEPPESVSSIIEPTQLQTNQSHQNTLDSQSTSPRTEFPELRCQRAGPTTLSSTTSDMNQVFENIKVPIDEHVIPVEKPMIPVNKPTITNYTPLVNKSPVEPPVLSPLFSSKCTELKKNRNPLETVSPIIEPTQLQDNQLHQHMLEPPESVSPIIEPTQLQTNQSHQNTLDSQSTSPRTEFPELRCQRAGPTTLSSTTSEMNQIFENIKVPIDKPVIPIEKPMIPVNKPTITNYTPSVNKSPIEPPVLSPLFSSKCTELKKNRNPLETVSPIIEPTQLQDNQLHQHMLEPPESVSPIIEPTQLQTNQSHQNTLDSQSTSPRTEFPELRCQRAGPTTLSSTTSEMNQIFENIKVPIDKPVIPIEKPMILVNKPTITNYTPSVNKSPVEPPVLSPFFSSKCTELKKNRNPLESVSPIIEPTQLQDNQLHQHTLEPPESVSSIIEPTQLQTNQSHQNTLDSQSTSPRTEFPELRCQRAGPTTLSSTTSDMNQVFENIKVPIDEHVIPVEKPMIPVNKPTITNYTPLVNKSPVEPPVLSPLFSSKCTELKKNRNPLETVSPIIEPTQLQDNQLHQHMLEPPESVSPIIEPTQLQTNQSHQNTLDSQSTSPRTEFPELRCQRAGPTTLSSTTSEMNQIFENIKVPIDKPVIPIEKPMIPVNKPTITNYTPSVNKSPIEPPVLSPLFSSKCTELKKNRNPLETVSPIIEPTQLQDNQLHQHMLEPPESVSPIIEPTQLQTNQSHQNTLDSQSTSPRTEFPELRCQRAGPTTLSSTTSEMNQIFENIKVPIDKPVIPIEKPMILVNKPTITNYTPSVNKSPVEPPVLSPFFSSKCTELKKNRNPLESVSPIIEPTQLQDNQLHQHTLEPPESVSSIIEPTQLQTNQSHQNTLDSQSTSPRTEFPELRRQRAGPTRLSSTTPNMIQLFEKLKSPYPNGMTFINHLLNLETFRNLGALTAEKNKTTYCQRTSNTATTPPHSIHCLPAQEEYQTISCIDNDLTNCENLCEKCVPSDENSSDSHFIPVKKTYKSCNIPKQKSNLPKSFENKQSQYYDNDDSKKQVIDLQENSSITYYPDITIASTTSTITMSITTTEASTNIVSATSSVFTTNSGSIIASEVPATVEMAAVAINTSPLTSAIADSTTSITDSTIDINNTEVITDTVTINYDKSETISTVNENTTVADAAAVKESATLYNTTALTMITNVASTTTNATVSATIDADSLTAVTTTVNDDTTLVEINTESSTITNAITTESPNSAKCADAFTIVNAFPVTSDIPTTTETIFETTIAASKISYDSEFMSNKNTVVTIPPIQCVST